MKRLLVLIGLLLISIAGWTQPATKQNNHRNWIRSSGNDKIALVIGNSLYQHNSPLEEPANDANRIADALEAQGFDVELGFNLGRTELYQAVDAFAEKMKNYKACVVYYAGHGFQVNGINYLVPVDANPESARAVPRDCIRDTYIIEAIDNPKIPKLILVDACRNNPFTRSWTATERSGIAPGMRAVQALENSIIVYATPEGTTVSDFNQFAESYARNIRIGGCIENINKRVANEVEEVIRPYGVIKGDFCLGVTTDRDSDGDGLLDSIDDCPTVFGLPADGGCPPKDSDGDGLLDKMDNCPDEKGPKENNGCPLPDDMVFVQGGWFEMGCTGEQGEDCWDPEKPVHRVYVDDFYIGATEVTVAQFEQFIKATGYKTTAEKEGSSIIYPFESKTGINWRHGVTGELRNAAEKHHPVIHVSWDDAVAYCKWMSARHPGRTYRLPTEAEWEYAARGGQKATGTKYAGSNDLNKVGWYIDNSNENTHPVRTKQPNSLGLYDMSGNVWEWCSDWYGDYSSSSQQNPTGPASGSIRVLRGGGWLSNARNCRVSSRSYISPGGRGLDVGFRVVSSPVQ